MQQPVRYESIVPYDRTTLLNTIVDGVRRTQGWINRTYYPPLVVPYMYHTVRKQCIVYINNTAVPVLIIMYNVNKIYAYPDIGYANLNILIYIVLLQH